MLDTIFRQALLLAQPIGFTWAVLLVLTIVLWRRQQRLIASVTALLALVLTVVGSTDLPGWLLRGLERPWAGFQPEKLERCDAVVVLGGGGEPSLHEVGQVHLTRAGDRLVMGAELMRLGKAPVMVLGGGAARFDSETKLEADLVRAGFLRWIPYAQIVSLGHCEHTRDEAAKVAALVKERGWKRVALVTSASHMARAVAVFQHAGVQVAPAPCNFLTTVSTAPSPARLQVPSWQGFEKVNIWVHENVGWVVYRRRGWIP